MTPDNREILAQALEAAARTLRGTGARLDLRAAPIPTAQQEGGREVGPILLRVSEAADALSISRATLYGLLASGGLPSVRIGSRRLIPREQLIEWVEQQLREQSFER